MAHGFWEKRVGRIPNGAVKRNVNFFVCGLTYFSVFCGSNRSSRHRILWIYHLNFCWKLFKKSYTTPRKCQKCSYSSKRCPTVYPNDHNTLLERHQQLSAAASSHQLMCCKDKIMHSLLSIFWWKWKSCNLYFRMSSLFVSSMVCFHFSPYQASVSFRVELISPTVVTQWKLNSWCSFINKDHNQWKQLLIVCKLYSTHIYLVNSFRNHPPLKSLKLWTWSESGLLSVKIWRKGNQKEI